jgi:hypothetical protein
MLKTASSITNAIGALNYKGTWNASSNNPVLTSGVGTKGDYYVVSVAGSTNLDGQTLWGVGDMAVFNGTAWQKVDGGNTSIVTDLTVTTLTGYMYANNTNPVTASTTIPVANITGAVPNTVNVLAGTGMSGGGALTANVTLNLANTAVAPATYGNATAVSSFTVDQQGRITNAGNVTIAIGNSNLQNSNVVLGNTTLTLGSTVSAVGNLSLNNVTINSVAATFPNNYLTNSTVIIGNTTIALGGSTANLGNVTLSNVTIIGGTTNASVFNFTGNTTTTATYGIASLPLQPAGFMQVNLNGVVVKVPYYAV